MSLNLSFKNHVSWILFISLTLSCNVAKRSTYEAHRAKTKVSHAAVKDSAQQYEEKVVRDTSNVRITEQVATEGTDTTYIERIEFAKPATAQEIQAGTALIQKLEKVKRIKNTFQDISRKHSAQIGKKIRETRQASRILEAAEDGLEDVKEEIKASETKKRRLSNLALFSVILGVGFMCYLILNYKKIIRRWI